MNGGKQSFAFAVKSHSLGACQSEFKKPKKKPRLDSFFLGGAHF
jgi:hypothetical protein